MKEERGSPHWGEDALDHPLVRLAKEFGKKSKAQGWAGWGGALGLGPGTQ